MGSAVLFSEMTPDAAWEGEFNNWYDSEHIPIRMQAPGFTGAQRYRRNERDYLAVYDMTDPDVLASSAYLQIKNHPSALTRRMLHDITGFSRYIGEEISVAVNSAAEDRKWIEAPVLYPVFFNVPEDDLQEFDDWYDTDHSPILLECGDWWAVRRFSLQVCEPHIYNRLALHYLASDSALESPERAKARDTNWRKRMAVRPWFKGTYMVFNAIGSRFDARQPRDGRHEGTVR